MKLPQLLLTAGASLLLTAGSRAVTVNVGFDAGTTNTTTALLGFVTTGAMMDGMVVTAFFSDASSQTLAWADTGATSGGVSGTGWSLSESGDTFGGLWSLSNSRGVNLVRLLIDAGPGGTVFDTFFGSSTGTPGSGGGMDFAVSSISVADNGDTITATYRDAVALGASLPVGDLYRRLDVDLSLSNGSTMVFVSDTDNSLIAGDIRSVPEPMSTFAGLAPAFLVMAMLMRRRSAAR